MSMKKQTMLLVIDIHAMKNVEKLQDDTEFSYFIIIPSM